MVLVQLCLFSVHIILLFHYFNSFFYLFNHFKQSSVSSPFQNIKLLIVLWLRWLSFDSSLFPHMVCNFLSWAHLILWAHVKQWWSFSVGVLDTLDYGFVPICGLIFGSARVPEFSWALSKFVFSCPIFC